jgi:hypothetical protein
MIPLGENSERNMNVGWSFIVEIEMMIKRFADRR